MLQSHRNQEQNYHFLSYATLLECLGHMETLAHYYIGNLFENTKHFKVLLRNMQEYNAQSNARILR